jgi:hypothetical protein
MLDSATSTTPGFIMTDKQTLKEVSTPATQTPAPMSRRALLSSASKAVPAIVTLYSGAALARSSNLISTDGTPGAENNKYRCLDTSSVLKTDKPTVYDLGNDPMAHVTRIDSTRQYYKSTWNGQVGSQTNAPSMCATGGDYYRKDWTGYKKVNVRQGVLVSATALSSFANDVTYTDV